MNYKIYRYHVTDNDISIDLFDEFNHSNIELKFCIYRRAKKLKSLINYIKYNHTIHGVVTPLYLIEQYEILLKALNE